MAAVTVLWNGTSNAVTKDLWEDLLSSMGHTVSVKDETAITGTSENGQALIVVLGMNQSEYASIETHLVNYHDGTSPATSPIPMIIGSMLTGPIFPNADGRGDSPASYLGLISSVEALNDFPVGSGEGLATLDVLGIELDDDYADSPVSHSMADVLLPFWMADGTNAHINVAARTYTETTGKKLWRTVEFDKKVTALAVDVGDSKVSAVGGTFAARAVWLGLANWFEGIAPHGGLIARAAVNWCLGVYDSLVFPTSNPGAHLRYPSLDLSPLGTYSSSSIDWTQTLPVGTAIAVSASTDGETFSPVSKGGGIPGLSLSDPLAGVRLYIKVELQTTDSSVTPEFSDLEVIVEGEGAVLTATPTDYFEKGHLTWTTGLNASLSMEVKDYDPATRTVTLFLDMPNAVQVDDEFDIYPGCKKRLIEDCAGKFSNAVNHQAEPYIPGEDVTRQWPDQKG